MTAVILKHIFLAPYDVCYQGRSINTCVLRATKQCHPSRTGPTASCRSAATNRCHNDFPPPSVTLDPLSYYPKYAFLGFFNCLVSWPWRMGFIALKRFCCKSVRNAVATSILFDGQEYQGCSLPVFLFSQLSLPVRIPYRFLISCLCVSLSVLITFEAVQSFSWTSFFGGHISSFPSIVLTWWLLKVASDAAGTYVVSWNFVRWEVSAECATSV